jgi:hypothetical protein
VRLNLQEGQIGNATNQYGMSGCLMLGFDFVGSQTSVGDHTL